MLMAVPQSDHHDLWTILYSEICQLPYLQRCLMPSKGFTILITISALGNTDSPLLNAWSVPTFQQTSVDEETQALKVGQLTPLMHDSRSVLKTLRGQKGIKRIRACCPVVSPPLVRLYGLF